MLQSLSFLPGVLSVLVVNSSTRYGTDLLMQTSSMHRNQNAAKTWSQRAVPWLCGAFGLLFLYHFFTVWMYVVNVPFWDEWAVFDGNALTPNLDASWIWAQHNEHRMITNKLVLWALYHLNGWDIGAHQVLNFVLYGGLVWAAVVLARRVAPQIPLAIPLAFALFLLSPVNHENHFMAFETAFHMVVLFSILAAFWLFKEVAPIADLQSANIEYSKLPEVCPQSWRALLMGVLFATLAMYSLSNGLIYSAATLLIFIVFKIVRLRALPPENRAQKQREKSQLLVVCLLMIVASALWFVGWNNTGSVPREAPFSWAFWNWYLSVLSAGFGFESYSALAGLACLAFVLAPLLLPLFENKSVPTGYWIVCAATLGVLLVLMSITVARASFGMGMSKTPRYVQFVLTFLPITIAGWWLLLQNVSSSKRRLTIGALWAFCFFSFLNEWSYFRYYGDKFLERQAGLECVANYYERGAGKEWRCRSIAPFPINNHLDKARRLDASFAREENLQNRIMRDSATATSAP